jgi:hypothetical protein
MSLSHNILLGAEIFFGSAAGLVMLALLFAALRRWRGGKFAADYPFPPTLEETAQAKAAHEGRLLRLAVAFDIFINVLLLNGQEDETISTHAWRAKLEGKRWGKAVSWWLDLFQPGHGAQAAAGDLERAEERIAVEKKALGFENKRPRVCLGPLPGSFVLRH